MSAPAEREIAPICFVDTETDGLHPDRKVWEVAVIRREPDGTEIEWESYVDIDLSTADRKGLSIGRFYDRHPLGLHLSRGTPWEVASWGDDGYLSTRDAAFRVAQLTHGAHLVGAVPSFDDLGLDHLLRSEGLISAWHYHLIDVEVLAVGYLRGRGITRSDGTPLVPPYRSDELTELLGIEAAEASEKHTAMGDVRWAMRMYDAVMGGMS